MRTWRARDKEEDMERVRVKAGEMAKRRDDRRKARREEEERRARLQRRRREVWPQVRADMVIAKMKADTDWAGRRREWLARREREQGEARDRAVAARRQREPATQHAVANTSLQHISQGEHNRAARTRQDVEGFYGPTGRKRKAGERQGAEEGEGEGPERGHKFRRVHIAEAGRRAMERIMGMTEGG